MARINGISIPGVTAQKDWRGNIVGATVNFKRCSNEVLSFFTSLGVRTEEEPKYDPKFVKKIKKSMEEAERGELTEIDIEDFFNR